MPPLDELVDRLTAVLDEEVALLHARRRQMAALSDTIVQRDNDAMGKLLQEMELAQDRQDRLDGELSEVRRRLAGALGVSPGAMRLEMVIQRLSGARRSAVESRRAAAMDATEALQRQHLQTSVLLIESARINRALLETLFPETRTAATYGAGGAAEGWSASARLVDSER